jgi:hypothetical protein
MKPCHLGYICELMAEIKTNKWGENICQSEQACQEWALSWGLPYRYISKEKQLIVVFRPTRYYWLKETTYRNTIADSNHDVFGKDCKIDGMKFGLMSAAATMYSPDADEEINVTEIIIRELTEAGWQEAIPLSMQPKISRDGIKAVMPTILRILGKFKKVVTEKLNGY